MSEVVITAQRRDQSIQDVPVSVTALSGQTLANAGIENTEGLTQVIPGLNFSRTAYFAQPYIRGVGSSSTSVGDESSVATYIDGVYVSSLESGLLDFLDIDSVQVLRGPQGTLFGRNATGGAILITTTAPRDEFESESRVSYGNFDNYQIQGYINGGIAPGVAASLSGSLSGRDSYVRNTYLDENGVPTRDGALRARVRWNATNNLSFNLIAGYSRNTTSDGLDLIAVSRNSVGEALGFNTTSYGLGSVLNGANSWDKTEDVDVSLQSDLKFEPFSVTSLTSWRQHTLHSLVDSDELPPILVQFNQNDFARDFQEDLRLQSSPGTKITWLGGVYYINSHSGYDPLLLQTPASATLNSDQITNSYSIYGDATVAINMRLNLTGGLRYSVETKSLDQFGSLPSSGIVDISSGKRSATFSALTPRVVLSYEQAPNLLIYASYSEGFKSGGFNQSGLSFLFTGGSFQDPAYRPEDLKSVEFGVKKTLETGIGSALISATLFHYYYNNLQVQFIDPSSGTAVIQNAASAQMNGIDIDTSLHVSHAMTLRAAVSYLDARYDHYEALVTVPNAPGEPFLYNGVQPLNCPAGVPVGCGNSDATLNVSGRQMVKAPKWTASTGGDYSLKLGGGFLADTGLNIYYNSGYPFEPSGRFRAGPYATANIKTDLHFPGEHLTVGIYLRNLTDTRALSSGLTSATGDFAEYIAPRTYGVVLGAKF